jgi:hypothetical protein
LAMTRAVASTSSKARKPPTARSILKSVEQIEVPVTGVRVRAYHAWDRRRIALDLPVWQALQFADTWLPATIDEWVEDAKALGWVPSVRRAWSSDRCRQDPKIVAHVADSNGQQVHLSIAHVGRGYVVTGKRCWKTMPDEHWEVTWTDDDRLTGA